MGQGADTHLAQTLPARRNLRSTRRLGRRRPKKIKRGTGRRIAASHLSLPDRRGRTTLCRERCYCSAYGKTHPSPPLRVRRRTAAREYGSGVEATAADQNEREKRWRIEIGARQRAQ